MRQPAAARQSIEADGLFPGLPLAAHPRRLEVNLGVRRLVPGGRHDVLPDERLQRYVGVVHVRPCPLCRHCHAPFGGLVRPHRPQAMGARLDAERVRLARLKRAGGVPIHVEPAGMTRPHP